MKKILIVIALVAITLPTWGATYYMATTGTDSAGQDGSTSNPWLTLEYSVSRMIGGDMLIIKDGSYSGSSNVLDQSHLPPSGTSGSPTIIQAENDGAAIFPDGFILFDGGGGREYINFIGLYAQNRTGIYGLSHIKFQRCSFFYDVSDGSTSREVNFNAVYSSYILVEDCAAWGGGRYKFACYAANLGETHHIIFRRCVGRFDRVNEDWPIATFTAYRSQYVAFQNCIAIDGDHDEFWLGNFEERSGAFYLPWGSENVSIDGCIVLNHKSYGFGGRPGTTYTVTDCISWNTAGGTWTRDDYASGAGFTVNRLTNGVGNDATTGYQPRTNYGIWTYEASNGTCVVNNSIFYDQANYALYSFDNPSSISSDYNSLYGNDTNYQSGVSAGANDITSTNPLSASLLYLPRIESGTALDGAGSSGSDIGANVLYKIGTTGTYYGDTGWNTVTEESLWPWPYEDRIKTEMSSYSYTGTIYGGGTDTLSGARGFCASGKQLNGTDDITLTSYIWEYLGNQMPSDIYGSTPSLHGVSLHGVDMR